MKKIGILVILALLMSGGGYYFLNQSPLSIEVIEKNPQRYNGTAVKIRGIVGEHFGIFGFGGFFLLNGNHRLAVLTDKGIPNTGADVEINGIFRQGIVINGASYSVILQLDSNTIENLVSRFGN